MSEWNAETAQWYADKYGEYATNRLAVEALELAPDAVILDIGCGTGSALRHLADRVPRGTLVGVDPISRMIEIAEERARAHPQGHRIEFREAPAERLPFDAATADWVFAFDSIDHWRDREAGLAEVRRVLGPGGRFAVVKDGGLPGGATARQELARELRRAGFEVLHERGLTEDDVSCTLWVCGLR